MFESPPGLLLVWTPSASGLPSRTFNFCIVPRQSDSESHCHCQWSDRDRRAHSVSGSTSKEPDTVTTWGAQREHTRSLLLAVAADNNWSPSACRGPASRRGAWLLFESSEPQTSSGPGRTPALSPPAGQLAPRVGGQQGTACQDRAQRHVSYIVQIGAATSESGHHIERGPGVSAGALCPRRRCRGGLGSLRRRLCSDGVRQCG
jgi:hypothetical protein